MTTTTTETQTEIQVRTTVLEIVKEYVKAEKAFHKAEDAFHKAQNGKTAAQEAKDSKYWPMTFEAIRLLDKENMDPDDVRDQFNEALRIAHGYKTKEDASKTELTNWRLMSGRVVKLAKKGKPWIDEHRDTEGNLPGIWRLLDKITAEEAATREEAVAKGKQEEGVARANKRTVSPPPKATKYNKAAGLVTVRKGKGRRLAPVEAEPNLEQVEAKCFEFIVENPERFVKSFDQLLDEAKFSNDALETLIEKIQKHLSKSKANK